MFFLNPHKQRATNKLWELYGCSLQSPIYHHDWREIAWRVISEWTGRGKNKELFLYFVIFPSREGKKQSGNAYSICSVIDKILIKANRNPQDKLQSFLFCSIFTPLKEMLVRSIFTRLKPNFNKDCLATVFIVPVLRPFTFFILWLRLHHSRFIFSLWDHHTRNGIKEWILGSLFQQSLLQPGHWCKRTSQCSV